MLNLSHTFQDIMMLYNVLIRKKAMMIARRIQERQISISHLASVHQNKKQNIRYIILREKKRKSMMVMVEIGPLSIL